MSQFVFTYETDNQIHIPECFDLIFPSEVSFSLSHVTTFPTLGPSTSSPKTCVFNASPNDHGTRVARPRYRRLGTLLTPDPYRRGVRIQEDIANEAWVVV